MGEWQEHEREVSVRHPHQDAGDDRQEARRGTERPGALVRRHPAQPKDPPEPDRKRHQEDEHHGLAQAQFVARGVVGHATARNDAGQRKAVEACADHQRRKPPLGGPPECPAEVVAAPVRTGKQTGRHGHRRQEQREHDQRDAPPGHQVLTDPEKAALAARAACPSQHREPRPSDKRVCPNRSSVSDDSRSLTELSGGSGSSPAEDRATACSPSATSAACSPAAAGTAYRAIWARALVLSAAEAGAVLEDLLSGPGEADWRPLSRRRRSRRTGRKARRIRAGRSRSRRRRWCGRASPSITSRAPSASALAPLVEARISVRFALGNGELVGKLEEDAGGGSARRCALALAGVPSGDEENRAVGSARQGQDHVSELDLGAVDCRLDRLLADRPRDDRSESLGNQVGCGVVRLRARLARIAQREHVASGLRGCRRRRTRACPAGGSTGSGALPSENASTTSAASAGDEGESVEAEVGHSCRPTLTDMGSATDAERHG